MNIDTTEVGFSLYQTPYIETLLQQYDMTDVYGVDTPVDARVALGVAENEKAKPVGKATCLAMVGVLMYPAFGHV